MLILILLFYFYSSLCSVPFLAFVWIFLMKTIKKITEINGINLTIPKTKSEKIKQKLTKVQGDAVRCLDDDHENKLLLNLQWFLKYRQLHFDRVSYLLIGSELINAFVMLFWFKSALRAYPFGFVFTKKRLF